LKVKILLKNFRIIAIDTYNNLTTYQQIQLVVNECVYGTAVWGNPTLISSSVSVLFCVCNNATYTGIEEIQ
jgi:hypothetical protein